MPSPERASIGWLVRKDLHQLVASRAFWLMLLVTGFLVGHAFLTAVATYAEMSGAGGGQSVLARGLSPLDGFLVPTFGAYEIAAIFLLPFVVIRLIGAERQSGALKLVLQARAGRGQAAASTAIVLLGCWLAVLLPGAIALVMWRVAGGHLAMSEVASVVAGQLILAAITAGVAAAATAVARNTSSAAILALSFTLGTWALDFAGGVRGGFVQELARYTPAAVLRTFNHGELRMATLVIALIVATAGFAVSATVMDLRSSVRQRAVRAVAIVLVALAAGALASRVRTSRDMSEDRRNSFAPADETALAAIHDPLRVEVHLAGEDPRRVDLDREVLAKLRRAMRVDVAYVGGTGTGMTSRADHYGEIIYSMKGRSDTTRSVIEPIVLEIIYRLAGVPAPAPTPGARAYPGYPLIKAPRGITLVFFVLWPLLVLVGWWSTTRRVSRA